MHLVIFPTIVSNQLWIVLNLLLTLQLSKSNCEFTPLAATHFLINKNKRMWCKIRILTSTWCVLVISLPVCWIMFENYREKFQVNHFWELKSLSTTSPFKSSWLYQILAYFLSFFKFHFLQDIFQNLLHLDFIIGWLV